MDCKVEGKAEVLYAVTNSVKDAPPLIEEIGDTLSACAEGLRVEQSEELFNALSEKMEDLGNLMDLVHGIRRSLEILEMPVDPLACWDREPQLYREMLSAFENGDWITLADLIQYEILPILTQGKKGFEEIYGRLTGAGGKAV